MEIIKTSKIRKLPSGKWRVLSSKGKNLGTYKTRGEALKRLRAVEFFKRQSYFNHFEQLIKNAEDQSNDTYSGIIRSLRQEHPEKVTNFMKTFSAYFNHAQQQNLNSPETWALSQTKLQFPELF